MTFRAFTGAILACVLLSGCGTTVREEAMEVLEQYAASDGGTMEFTAEYHWPEEMLSYDLRYEGGSQGGAVTVLAPEEVAGTVLTVREEDGSLTYSDMTVETGRAGGAGISPGGVGTLLWQLWSEGYCTECCRETLDGTETIRCRMEMGETVGTTWFSEETGEPVRSELEEDGRTVLVCRFSTGKEDLTK